jgi:hypothetical protein
MRPLHIDVLPTQQVARADCSDRRAAFDVAVRFLDEDSEDCNHARWLELVIRLSRPLSSDDGLLPDETCDALIRLRERYHLLAPFDLRIDPITYRSARRLIEELFF